MKRTLDLDERQHRLLIEMKMDLLLLSFARILMGAAIITLAMITLSIFEIPFVHVNQDLVKILIKAVIVEIAGTVGTSFVKARNVQSRKGKNVD